MRSELKIEQEKYLEKRKECKTIWDTVKSYDICAIGKERRKQYINRGFFVLNRFFKNQAPKAKHSLNSQAGLIINKQQHTPRHIIIKPVRTKDKRDNFISSQRVG